MLNTCVGQALMEIKASFNNIADVLLDWDDLHNDDFCSWRGVYCDNLTLTVLTLYDFISIPLRLLLASLIIATWNKCLLVLEGPSLLSQLKYQFCNQRLHLGEMLFKLSYIELTLCALLVSEGICQVWILVGRYRQPLVIWETCNQCMHVRVCLIHSSLNYLLKDILLPH